MTQRYDAPPLKDRPFGVIDIHAHPTMKTFMFGHKFWKAHNPPGFLFPLCMRTDLDALIDGGVQALLVAIYVVEKDIVTDFPPLKYLLPLAPKIARIVREDPDVMTREYLDHLDQVVAETRARRGEVLEIARSYADMRRIIAEGKLALVNSIEGSHHLNGNLDRLDEFHRRGVGHMILQHFYTNEAGGTVDPVPATYPISKIGLHKYQFELDKGLTPWGRELLDRMLDIGVVADLTHAPPKFRQEAYEVARGHAKRRPLVMSHVGMHDLAPYPMNPTPEDIRAIADTGGVVGIIFSRWWLHRPEQADCSDILLRTVEHLVEHGGEDVVAFGSDFDGFTDVPRDFKSPRDYNRVRGLLLGRYSDSQVEKFLNGNADRVLRDGWDAPR
jgi:membrane dipeptidase